MRCVLRESVFCSDLAPHAFVHRSTKRPKSRASTCSLPFRFAESAEVILGAEILNEPIFNLLHATALNASLIVVVAQVQDTVGDIAHKLALPVRAIAAGLAVCFFNANEYFPGEYSLPGFGVIEADDVRRAAVQQVSFVDVCDSRVVNEGNCEFKFIKPQFVLQKAANDPAKKGQVEAPDALSISQDKIPAQGSSGGGGGRVLPRCSS